MLKSLASKVGKFISTEGVSNDYEGNFYRVWVKVDVTEPLRSVVSMIRANKREPFLVKYEKLPNWCQVCGHLGHEFKDHGDGIHPPASLVYKNLRASWSMRTGGKPNRGCAGARGGWSSSFPSRYAKEDDLSEDGFVEEKDPDVDMAEAERITKRDAQGLGIYSNAIMPPGTVAAMAGVLTGKELTVSSSPTVPPSPHPKGTRSGRGLGKI